MGKRKMKKKVSELKKQLKSLSKQLGKRKRSYSRSSEDSESSSQSSSTDSSRRDHKYSKSRSSHRLRSKSRRRSVKRSRRSGGSSCERSHERSRSRTSRSPSRGLGSEDSVRKSRTRSPSREQEKDKTTSPAETTEPVQTTKTEMDAKDLEVFGERPLPERTLAPPLKDHLTNIINDILNKGLPSDERKKFLKCFPPPENCLIMDPPKLNIEVKAAVDSSIQKRDERILEKQEKISAALAGISKTIDLVLKTNLEDKKILLEPLNGIMRILSDLQHDETQIRRSLILKNIAAPIRDTLKDLPFDNWLFAKDLLDKLKAAKALHQSSKDLKPASKNSNDKKGNSKNFKSPTPSYHQKRNYPTRGNGPRFSNNNSSRYQKPPPFRGKSSNRKPENPNAKKMA